MTGGQVLEHQVPTPRGPAGVRLLRPGGGPVALAALGHGAGGGVDAPDLAAVARALLAEHVAVALVTQPYRLAGRRAPAPAPALDEAWLAVVAALPGLDDALAGLPLVAGGRSSGARVACRTAASAGARGVVALAFPLVPPARGSGGGPLRPRPSREAELRQAVRAGHVLVVQGESDPFGGPAAVRAAAGPEVAVHGVPGGDHSLRSGRPRGVPEDVGAAVAAAVLSWCRAGG